MKNEIMSRFKFLLALEKRIEQIASLSKSSKVLDETRSLNWAINELYGLYCEKVILIISSNKLTDLEMTKQKSGSLTSIIEINPSKFEISLLRKFMKLDQSHLEINAKDEISPYVLCDRYNIVKLNQDSVIYIEAYIPKNVIYDIGNKELVSHLKKWLLSLWKALKPKL